MSATSSGRPPGRPPGLPRALAPWVDAFGAMPQAQTLAIGELMGALAPLLESMVQDRRDGFSELEGFDDLAAHGPLDRLIISELMWLNLLPGEFARRVVEREALRRRPVYRDKSERRAVTVLVDSGPEMLGRKRLLALAALLWLAASAHERGARMLWSTSGFVREPLWIEGVDRRGLSRLIQQTTTAPFDDGFVESRLAALDLGRTPSLLWTIGGPDAPAPHDGYRLSFEEIWELGGSGAARRRRVVGAEAAATAAGGARRSTRVRFPPERVCADVMRAPFRAQPTETANAARHWAPRWIAQAHELDPLLIRMSDGLAMLRAQRLRIAVTAPEESDMLGLRWPANGVCGAMWRRGVDIAAARFRADGRIVDRATARLSDDHPLLAGATPDAAAPPLLRIGRSAEFSTADADGALYAIRYHGDVGALLIERAQHLQDLRLLAVAERWFFCAASASARGLYVLAHARTGRRRYLRAETEAPVRKGVRACARIGDFGGALIADVGGWRWLPMWSGDPWTPPPAPPVEKSALLLSVDARRYLAGVWPPHGASTPIPNRPWSAWFWSAERGVERCDYDGEQWRPSPIRSPPIDERVLAMARVGARVYAVVNDEGGDQRLVEFGIGDTRAPTRCDTSEWWGKAPCVEL